MKTAGWKKKDLEGFKRRRESGLIWRSVNSHGDGGNGSNGGPSPAETSGCSRLWLSQRFTPVLDLLLRLVFVGRTGKERRYVDANGRAGVSRWKSHAAIVLPQVLV